MGYVAANIGCGVSCVCELMVRELYDATIAWSILAY